MKKRLKLSLLALILSLFCGSGLAACGNVGEHEHLFSDDWRYDAEGHWHYAVCGHDDLKADYAPHKEGADGGCSICGYRGESTAGLKFTLNPDGQSYSVSAESPYSFTTPTVPAEYDGKPVTAVAAGGFSDTRITSITLPAGIKEIGDRAFYCCFSLASIDLPDELESIGNEAFAVCELIPEFDIGGKVETIGDDAFNGCNSLERFKLDGKNTHFSIADGVLYDVGKTKVVAVPKKLGGNVTIPNTVTDIGEAFAGTAITGITVPASVRIISDGAFMACASLKTAVINGGAERMGHYMFSGCNAIESVTIPYVGAEKDKKGNTHFNYIFNNLNYLGNAELPATLKTVTVLGGTRIAANAFKKAGAIEKVILPDTIEEISDNAFENCSALKEIKIGERVKTIGEKAFYRCTSLVNITVPDGVEELGAYAFSECSSLRSINVPDSLTEIAEYAYAGCTSMISFDLPNTIDYIDDGAFSGCTSLTSFTIPNSVLSVGSDVLKDCSGLESITIPFTGDRSERHELGNVHNIDHVAFLFGDRYVNVGSNRLPRLPEKLRAVTITDSTRIKEGAFYNCVYLTNIDLPDGLTHIGETAFYGCGGLTRENFKLPDTVVYAASGAFTNVMATELFTEYDGGYYVGSENNPYMMFYSTKKEYSESHPTEPTTTLALHADTKVIVNLPSLLTSLSVPSGIRAVCAWFGPNVDLGNFCTSYGNSWYLGNNNENAHAVLLKAENTDITSCDVHADTKVVAYGAFMDCAELTDITIPEGVICIGDEAFYGCDKLESVAVNANNSNYMGKDGILYDKDGTKFIHIPTALGGDIVLPDGITVIESGAFESRRITGVVLPNGLTSIGTGAFMKCAELTGVNIPKNVNNIGYGAFMECAKLESITVAADNAYYSSYGGVLYDKAKTGIKQAPQGIRGAVTIPGGVTRIWGTAFMNCANMTEITIPTSVTIIEQLSFAGCSSLTKITYLGTIEQWQGVTKENNWYGGSGSFTIQCSDGETPRN